MKHNYLSWLLGLAIVGTSLTAEAIERPKTPAGAPQEGGKYILVNAYNPTGYMSRTSWDGAFYFLGETDSRYANHAFTAEKNENGSWSFYIPSTDSEGETVKNYIAIPSGTGNLNAKSEEAAEWILEEGTISGYYGLRASYGNSTSVQDYLLHLNASGQYFVISEKISGGGWYPDFAGGAVVEDDPLAEDIVMNNGVAYRIGEDGRCIFVTHDSENWQFLAVEDVPEYMGLLQCYSSIENFEKNYCAIDDFDEGFQATLDAITAIYESSDFIYASDGPVISQMIQAKVALYEAIVKADEYGADELSNAITSAKNAFDGNTSVEAINAAKEALDAAILAYEKGTNNLTGLGQNMSFEDLSSQGGNPTSGVAGAPTGWNIYIKGKQATTAADVLNAGIANWHGINGDGVGEGKDGNNIFGLWTGTVPEYEISQKIEGLENGTYTITAGVMVGANGSGSRRTTQRIFGNLNTTYFASEYDYDMEQLNPVEVPTFADLAEPQTDTELQLMSVRAYVYDGTLTFGFRTNGNYAAAFRDSGNGAGGDGWFKIDNFRIMGEGYIAQDAADIANYFLEKYSDYKYEYMAEELHEIVSKYATTEKYTASTPADELNAAIAELSANLEEVKASVKAYNELSEKIANSYDESDPYQYYSGFEDYITLLDNLYEAVEEGTLTTEAAIKALDDIDEAFLELQKSGIAVGEYMNIIKNPSFEDYSAQNNGNFGSVANPPAGWTLKFNDVECATSAEYGAAGANMGWCAINEGDGINEVDQNGTEWFAQYTDGNHLWGIWAGNMPKVELSQHFSGLPAGTYVLSCDMVVQYNWGGHCVTTQQIFANDYICMYGAEETYAAELNDTPEMAAARQFDAENPDADLKKLNYAGWLNDVKESYTSCPHHVELTFGVDESGELTFGFRTNNVDPDGTPHPYDSAGWFKLDNFRLFYQSEEIPTSINTVGNSSKTIATQQYFNASGARIAQPQHGVNIIKNIMSDGSVVTVKLMK